MPKKKQHLILATLTLVHLAALAADTPKKPYPWEKDASTGRPAPAKKPTLDGTPKDCGAALSDPNYVNLAEQLARLTSNDVVVRQLRDAGLQITDRSWNDTGRTQYSSGGTNISDVMLNAITRSRSGEMKTIAQPIIRLPNYEDKTVDIDLEKVFIPVGNSWGVPTFRVPLADFIENIELFLSSREAPKGSLLLPRDREVLVSAQASIMPVLRGGEAHFVPSIYNYQSTPENPALLVIMVTNRGTSVTVIDNKRDALPGASWGGGQMIFHNKDGEKAPLVLSSLADEKATKKGRKKVGELSSSGQEIAGVNGVNQVMLISIPLKYPPRMRRSLGLALGAGALESAPVRSRSMRGAGPARGLDTGVVDVAKYTLGRYVELDGKGSKLERDPNLPIRIDVMRYMASDTADLTRKEVESLPEELRAIYEAGSNLGSLVTGDDGTRITRNFKPWLLPWWNVVVVPYIPRPYISRPEEYFVTVFGPAWKYRFATEESARVALRSLPNAE